MVLSCHCFHCRPLQKILLTGLLLLLPLRFVVTVSFSDGLDITSMVYMLKFSTVSTNHMEAFMRFLGVYSLPCAT